MNVHLQNGVASCPESDLGESIPLAELGSVQLEFSALGALLHEPSMARLAAAREVRACTPTLQALSEGSTRERCAALYRLPSVIALVVGA